MKLFAITTIHVILFIGLLETTSATSSQSCYKRYGDFMKLSPKGAGSATSKASRLNYTGVKASEQIAKASLSSIRSLWPKIEKTADEICVDPAIIAGLASRESNAGQLLKKCKGWGDCKTNSCDTCHAIGILQCDIHTSGIGKECQKHKWDSQELMELVLTHVLIPSILAVRKKHPKWTQEQQLQGAIAAYNFGVKNVQTWKGVDIGTTNDDYSNDVIARAQYYKRQMSSKPLTLHSTSLGSNISAQCINLIIIVMGFLWLI